MCKQPVRADAVPRELVKVKICTDCYFKHVKNKPNPYRLFKGEKSEGYPDYTTKTYRGSMRQIQELVFPDIATAHQVAKLAGLDSYAIADENDSWGSKPVFRTDDMIRYSAEEKIASEKADIAKHEKIEKLSKSPRGYIISRYGKVAIYAKRKSPSEERTGVRVFPRVYMARPGRRAIMIELDTYITHGKYNKKKFLNDFAGFFGGNSAERGHASRYSRSQRRTIEGIPAVAGTYPEPLPTIANDLPEIKKKYDDFRLVNWQNPMRRTVRRNTVTSNPKSGQKTALLVLAALCGLWFATRK